MYRGQNLVPVGDTEIELGKPLPYAAYDSNHTLLFRRGEVLNSRFELDILLQQGLYRESESASLPDAARDAPEEDKPVAGKSLGERLSFDAIKLMPGDDLQMQPLQEGQIEKFTVQVIGVVKQKSLLVTAPELEEELIFARDAQTYLARVFSGLNVCAFKTKILRSQLLPFPYLHLAYPNSVQAMRIRKAMRAPASIIVAVHENEAASQSGAGKIIDISVGGARLQTPMNIGVKDQTVWLSFKVRLGDMEEYIKTPAIIRAISQEYDNQGKRVNMYGVQFGDLSQAQRLIIMNLVYQHLLKDPT